MSKSRIVPLDAIVLFADLQEGIADLPLTTPLPKLKKSVLALAKLAKLFEIPVIVTAVPGSDGTAKILPEIEEGYGKLPTYYRTTADLFLNEAITQAIEATGRKTLLLSGVATELAVQLPALTGVDQGYRTFIVLDACGGTSERTEQAAIHRALANGGSTTAVITLAGELAGDFRSDKAQQAIGILFSLAKSD